MRVGVDPLTGLPQVQPDPTVRVFGSGGGGKGGGSGTGDMLAATYDPAGIAQQVVGTTASQTLTNKTLSAPNIANDGSSIPGSNAGLDAAFTNTLRLYNNYTSGNTQIVTPNGSTDFYAGGNGVATFSSTGLNINSTYALTKNGVAVPTISSTNTLTNKTLTTPVIADFTNATHNHSNAAGGGNIPESSVTNLTTDLAAKVVGPASATDTALTAFDGTTGKLVKNTAITTNSSSGNTLFGSNTSSSTATPLNVSFGGTFGSNTAGTVGNLKWDMYNNGSGNRYGIGMSAGVMEYQAGSGGSHAFYTNQGTLALYLDGTSNFVRVVTAGTTNDSVTVNAGTQTLTNKTLTSPKVTSGNAPATAASTGTAGQIEWDSGFVYVCVATNTWKRVAIASW